MNIEINVKTWAITTTLLLYVERTMNTISKANLAVDLEEEVKKKTDPSTTPWRKVNQSPATSLAALGWRV